MKEIHFVGEIDQKTVLRDNVYSVLMPSALPDSYRPITDDQSGLPLISGWPNCHNVL